MLGSIRVVTHRRILPKPLAASDVLDFLDVLRSSPLVADVSPGRHHGGIFRDLCVAADVRGNLVPDAWLAALAIEHRATVATFDRDFARFKGLRWFIPGA